MLNALAFCEKGETNVLYFSCAWNTNSSLFYVTHPNCQTRPVSHDLLISLESR